MILVFTLFSFFYSRLDFSSIFISSDQRMLLKSDVTTTVSSVNFSVQDSMSVQCSCGEISF